MKYYTLLPLALVTGQLAFGDIVYSITADPNAGFVPQILDAIDTAGQSVSAPFALGNGSLGFTGGLAYRSSNKTFYAISQDNFGDSVFNSFTLAGGPPVTPLFTLGFGFTGGLTFDSANGFFYAVDNDPLGNSSLYRIDASGGGSVTPLFALGTGFTGGLAFDSANGLLYAIANDNGGNSTLDSITLGGTVTPLALTLGQGFTGGLAYSSGAGQFYAVSSDSFGNSSLSAFTLGSSSATSLFAVPSGTNNAALTVGPAGGVVATPEPSTLPMLLIGAALVVIGYRRRSLRGAAVVAAAIVASAGSSFAQYSQPVHDVDNPARQPAKFFLNITTLANGNPPITFVNFVPLGKRLVLEHIQISCDHDASGTGIREFDPNVKLIGGFRLPPSSPPPGNAFWIDHQLRYYADPGSELVLDLPNLGPVVFNCSFLATGYYVNLP